MLLLGETFVSVESVDSKVSEMIIAIPFIFLVGISDDKK